MTEVDSERSHEAGWANPTEGNGIETSECSIEIQRRHSKNTGGDLSAPQGCGWEANHKAKLTQKFNLINYTEKGGGNLSRARHGILCCVLDAILSNEKDPIQSLKMFPQGMWELKDIIKIAYFWRVIMWERDWIIPKANTDISVRSFIQQVLLSSCPVWGTV